MGVYVGGGLCDCEQCLDVDVTVSVCVLPRSVNAQRDIHPPYLCRGYNKRKLDENLECEIMQVGSTVHTFCLHAVAW